MVEVVIPSEIHENCPQVRSFSLHKTAFLTKYDQICLSKIKDGDQEFKDSNIKTTTLPFITLTHSGIKEEGQPDKFYFRNFEDAIASYRKELFEFINSESQQDCELAWRMIPEVQKVLLDTTIESSGKIYQSEITVYAVRSRLLIKKLN